MTSESTAAETPQDQVPGKVKAIAILTLVGGIIALLDGLVMFVFLFFTCIGLLWPGTYFAIVVGILAIVKGSTLLARDGRGRTAPYPTAIMQMVNVINFDIINFVLGLIILVLLRDPKIKAAYSP